MYGDFKCDRDAVFNTTSSVMAKDVVKGSTPLDDSMPKEMLEENQLEQAHPAESFSQSTYSEAD